MNRLKNNALYRLACRCVDRLNQQREWKTWIRNGKQGSPPHLHKQKMLKEYAKKYRCRTLVETGTYLGDMVHAMRNHFETIYSIELSRELYERACERFKGNRQIKLICGDSAVQLGKIIGELQPPVLFWLDGHYSAGITAKADKYTPIIDELETILKQATGDNVILIDDARCFGKVPDYPEIATIQAIIETKMPSANIVVEDDTIRVTPW